MRVSVNIVTYQSMPHIVEALSSLERQTHTDFRVIVVDNASGDDTVKTLIDSYGNRITLLRNYQNIGFAAAHNQAIALAKRGGADYVLAMNPDVVLEITTLAELLHCAERHPKSGAVAARLLRPPGTHIDSTGMRCRRSFHVFERGCGKPSEGNYLREEQVFGASGALALYRVAALDDIGPGGQYFDEDFFAYKEDIDLSWRLRLRGWEIWYAPKAVALHTRSVREPEEAGFRFLRSTRAARSSAVARWSYRNHWWMVFKDAQASLALRNSPWLFARESLKALYLLCFEFSTLWTGMREVLAGFPRMLRKRHVIMASSTVSSRQMQLWFR